MYRDLKDLLEDWKEESQATLKVFEKIPDAALAQKIPGYDRTLGKVAWHITQTMTEMGKLASIFDEDDLSEKPIPAATAEIISAYKEKASHIEKVITEKVKPESLFIPMELYGEKWELRKVFYVLLKHQTHHRAQMTVLMRQAGLAVPGVYGPSKEEWVSYNMPPQE